MIISDLEHLEVVAEETNVLGAGDKKKSYKPKKKYYPKAEAYAKADSTAIGKQTYTDAYTNTVAVAGVFSKSSAESYAKAKG